MRRAFGSQTGTGTVARTVGFALEWLDGRFIDPKHARMLLKRNLTWRRPIPGATTTPAFVAAVVEALQKHTRNIVTGELDGGCSEAFESHGIYDLRERFGVQAVNLRDGPSESRAVDIAGHPVTVDLPRLFLYEVDLFATLPVTTVQPMTRVSLGFKNQ